MAPVGLFHQFSTDSNAFVGRKYIYISDFRSKKIPCLMSNSHSLIVWSIYCSRSKTGPYSLTSFGEFARFLLLRLILIPNFYTPSSSFHKTAILHHQHVIFSDANANLPTYQDICQVGDFALILLILLTIALDVQEYLQNRTWEPWLCARRTKVSSKPYLKASSLALDVPNQVQDHTWDP